MSKKPKTYPQIGFSDARAQLNEVLIPAYRRFNERGTRVHTLEVAQAAWALHERLWHDGGCTPILERFRADLFNACPELRLMRDVAETGKHTGLRRTNVLVERITGSENPGGTLEISGPLGNYTTKPTCTLTIETNGKNYPVPETLKTVVEFWAAKLK